MRDHKHIYRGQSGRIDNEHKCIICDKVTLNSEVHPWTNSI